MSEIKAYLQLVRPANLVTALTDVIAGVALSGYFSLPAFEPVPFLWLAGSTIFLYGGGIVFNDVFDAELDAVERPERPIPSGRVSLRKAIVYGLLLLSAGIGFGFAAGSGSGIIALLITAFALIYDKWGKHNTVLGPLNMGLCRGLNLLLGISIIPAALETSFTAGFIPVVYIAAVTMVSRGEVHGGSRGILRTALVMYLLVCAAQLWVAYQNGYLFPAVLFATAHLYMVLTPLAKAIREPVGPNIGKAVKAGVLGLIIMDAVWVSSGGNYLLALGVIALLPVSVGLARFFAVT